MREMDACKFMMKRDINYPVDLTCSSSSGWKARTPLTESFWIDAMALDHRANKKYTSN